MREVPAFAAERPMEREVEAVDRRREEPAPGLTRGASGSPLSDGPEERGHHERALGRTVGNLVRGPVSLS